jgi:hypothetical protein
LLSKYAALVKNLRGVILADFDERGVQESLEWLSKHFKYRDLALSPSLAELRKVNGLEKFLELVYPAEELRRMVKLFSDYLTSPFEACEAVILASTYVSPVMAVGKWAFKALEPLTVKIVKSNVKLDVKGWKLHFRIADYTVLDSYNWSVAHAEKLWNQKFEADKFRSERVEKIRKDSKRYWRLAKGENEGKPLILYLDLAYLAAGSRDFLGKIRKLRVETSSAGLALEVAVLIPGGLS